MTNSRFVTYPSLPSAHADGWEMRRLLRKDGPATPFGGFTVDWRHDADGSEQETVVKRFLRGAEFEDTRLLYLATHAVYVASDRTNPKRKVYFAGADTVDERLESTALSVDTVAEEIAACRAFTIVIADTCYAGQIADTVRDLIKDQLGGPFAERARRSMDPVGLGLDLKPGGPAEGARSKIVPGPPRHVVLASCGKYSSSVETRRRSASPFTRSFMEIAENGTWFDADARAAMMVSAQKQMFAGLSDNGYSPQIYVDSERWQ